ncbi:hypothetical protein BDV34DRAFT_194341 [Aspergillus parasiticus]|uniref:Uncharacterized protein n=1 Tax=Aspergillus parasiticus TaxID=5067 RepID=A0A5N6DLY2_ASPPA|nr:hypothetical protein BDV34DRAFT_194341 [Aspergillus parasiticus]
MRRVRTGRLINQAAPYVQLRPYMVVPESLRPSLWELCRRAFYQHRRIPKVVGAALMQLSFCARSLGFFRSSRMLSQRADIMMIPLGLRSTSLENLAVPTPRNDLRIAVTRTKHSGKGILLPKVGFAETSRDHRLTQDTGVSRHPYFCPHPQASHIYGTDRKRSAYYTSGSN